MRSGEIWRKEEIGEGAQHEYDDPREQPQWVNVCVWNVGLWFRVQLSPSMNSDCSNYF